MLRFACSNEHMHVNSYQIMHISVILETMKRAGPLSSIISPPQSTDVFAYMCVFKMHALHMYNVSLCLVLVSHTRARINC